MIIEAIGMGESIENARLAALKELGFSKSRRIRKANIAASADKAASPT